MLTSSKQQALSFNLSHSHGLALFAITRVRRIGIDLERIRTDCPCGQIAERFFSSRESAKLQALPAMEKLRAFFACWTRKEAYAKAKGEGLSLPFDQFEVSLSPQEPPMLLEVHGDRHEASRWSIQELFLGDDYVAALAIEGHDWDLECWKWQDHPG